MFILHLGTKITTDMAGRKPALTPQALKEVKADIMKGTRPQEIADRFNVGVATIHNVKSALKKEGKKVPQSPRGNPGISRVTTNAPESANTAIVRDSTGGKFKGLKSERSSTKESNETTNQMRFELNGVVVIIESGDKNVSIRTTAKGINIEF